MKLTTYKNKEESLDIKSNRTTNNQLTIDTFYPNFSYKNSKGQIITPKNSNLL